MSPKKRALFLLAATLFITPLFAATPAKAERTVYRRVVDSRRVVNTRDNRPVVVNQRAVRLSNGDFRLPHGEIVSARRIVRLRNQGYYRLPNGDIVIPSQEIVPARRIVRISNNTFRLPSGVIVRL